MQHEKIKPSPFSWLKQGGHPLPKKLLRPFLFPPYHSLEDRRLVFVDDGDSMWWIDAGLLEHFEYLETEEGGSGPRTLRIPINVPDNVKARVSLDLYGDKRLVLPLGGKYWDSDKPIELQIGRPRDLDMD